MPKKDLRSDKHLSNIINLPTLKDNIQVGHTRKPFGVNGQLKLQIEPIYLEDVLKADVLFIEIGGQQVPHFIDDFQEAGDLIVHFEDIETREQAAKIVSRPVFLRLADIIPIEEKEIPLEKIEPHLKYLHYQIEEVELGKIGPIIRIEKFPQQEMAFVDYKGREVMIPLHPSFVVKEDKEQRVLVMVLPEGILRLG